MTLKLDGTGAITGVDQGLNVVGVGTYSTDLNVGGNLNVTGVLTYDDVTNIDSVGIITARSDISIADKIVHTGDTNTAIRFPAADTFTVETGGSERFRIDSTGNTLIYGVLRKDNVNSSLSISGGNGADSSANIVLHGSSGSPANVTQFKTGSTERLRITSDGRIGIGTDNPDQAVEINGTVKFTAGTSTEGAQMLVLPLEDITLASNASASISVGARFTGMIIVAGYSNDTPGGVWAVASASAYDVDAVTRIQFKNHPASNISDLTITSPSVGGTHQFQLNQTGTSTKTYKVFAMGIYG